MLETKDISVIISKKTIIQDISYQFEKGIIYGIIGPNGAGKSTYLKVLSGFLKPTIGQVHFQGKALIEPQKNISIVWQKPYMFQTTVYRNLMYGLKLRGIKKREMKERIEEISQLFQLNNILEQQATSLSGGETAKVAIARAVVLSPEILILDEPTASLDPKSVLEIEQIIKNLKFKYNMSIILVTHNMFQAKRIAEVTLFFHGGRLIESLPTKDLFNNSTNPLTKNFVSGESFY